MHSTSVSLRLRQWLMGLVIATVVALLPVSAHAAVIPMSLEDLSVTADAVVVVKVTGSKARDASKGRVDRPDIVTDSKVHVTKVIAGARKVDLTITQPGGVLGEIGLAVSDIPDFEPGEQAVLFLDAENRLVGAFQGKLLVERGSVLGYDVTVNELARQVAAYRLGISPSVTAPLQVRPSTDSAALVPGATEVDQTTSFSTAAGPSITSITPDKQISGADRTIVIMGSGFGSSPGTVDFPCGKSLPAARRAGSVVSWSDSRIEVVVPGVVSGVDETGPVAAGAVVVTTGVGATASHNYNLGFATLNRKFANPVITYRINENCPDMTGEGAEIRKAFHTWNNAGSNFQIVDGGSSTYSTYPPSQNQRNDIFFSSNFGTSQSLAVNYSWFYTSNNTIIESDVIFNDAYRWGSSAGTNVWDVQTVAVHELGHSVGLADQYINYDRAMGAVVGGRNRRTLSEHEIAGAIFLHGAQPPLPALPAVSSTSHPSQATWYIVDAASMTFSATGGGEVAGYSWVIDTSSSTVPNTSINTTASTVTALIAEGERWFHVRAIGTDGRAGPTAHYRLRTDRTAPTGSVQIGPTSGFVNVTSVAVTASLSDALSGVSQMRSDIGSGFGAWQTFSANTSVALAGADGPHAIRIEYRDAAGNVRAFNREVVLDRIAPATTTNAESSYEGKAVIELKAEDERSGVTDIFYGFNGTPSIRYTGPITVSTSGIHNLTYRAVDGAGNQEAPRTVSFTILALPGAEQTEVVRAAGRDRFATAVQVGRQAFPGWQGVTDVVIASGDNHAMADPLAASGLAGVYDAPILLVQDKLVEGKLPPATESAIAAIKSANGNSVRFHVVGGTTVVPANVYSRLAALRGTQGSIERVAGRDRYATSVEIAKKMISVVGAESIPGVLVANGGDSRAFFDALAASPIAYSTHRPLLLVQSSGVPGVVRDALRVPLAGKPRTVVNASGFVSDSIYSSVSASSRLATSTERKRAAIQIADRATMNGWLDNTNAAVASGLPDALTGGAAMGQLGGPMLYTDRDALFEGTSNWISSRSTIISKVIVVGGEAVVAPATFVSLSIAAQ